MVFLVNLLYGLFAWEKVAVRISDYNSLHYRLISLQGGTLYACYAQS